MIPLTYSRMLAYPLTRLKSSFLTCIGIGSACVYELSYRREPIRLVLPFSFSFFIIFSSLVIVSSSVFTIFVNYFNHNQIHHIIHAWTPAFKYIKIYILIFPTPNIVAQFRTISPTKTKMNQTKYNLYSDFIYIHTDF